MTGDVGDVVGQDVIIVGLVYVIEWISSIINWLCIQQRGRGQRERDEIMMRVWGESKCQPWWAWTAGRAKASSM